MTTFCTDIKARIREAITEQYGGIKAFVQAKHETLNYTPTNLIQALRPGTNTRVGTLIKVCDLLGLEIKVCSVKKK